MANRDGHSATLVAAHPGNSNREVHGYYSRRRRELTPEAAEIADELMTLPHVTAADRLAAEEIGRLLVMIDRIDAALADGKVQSRGGAPRKLIDFRFRASKELREWLDRFGLTPKGRADWVATLSSGRRFVDELAELNGHGSERRAV